MAFSLLLEAAAVEDGVGNGLDTPYVPTVLTNAAQVGAAWQEFEWHYPAGVYPWRPGWFEPAAVWWTDFEQLEASLGQVRKTGEEKQLGVPMWPIWVALWPASGKIEVLRPGDEDWRLPLRALELNPAQSVWEGLLQDFSQLAGLTLAKAQASAEGEAAFPERVAVLNLWLADARDQAVFEKNLALAAAKWMADEAEARKQANAMPSQSAATELGGGGMLLMGEGGGDPCDSTNAPPRLGFTLVVTASNVLAHVEFPSCSSHLYQLQTSTNMLDWAEVMTLLGENAMTTWEQPANEDRRFFRLFRMALDGDEDNDGLTNGAEFSTYGTNPCRPDTDGDGMPDGWEIQYGFNPLSASDGSADYDGDGVSNAVEYVQGRDPTKGAVADTGNMVKLEVFTLME